MKTEKLAKLLTETKEKPTQEDFQWAKNIIDKRENCPWKCKKDNKNCLCK